MIKYKYLPFTRNKPRYQRVGEPTVASKWQLAAQTLPATSDKMEDKLLTTETTPTVVGAASTAATTTLLASTSAIAAATTTSTTNVAKPPQIIMIDEWIKNY